MKNKELRTYWRTCKRCGESYKTDSRYGRICVKCRKKPERIWRSKPYYTEILGI